MPKKAAKAGSKQSPKKQTVHVAEEDQISTATFVAKKLTPLYRVSVPIVAICAAGGAIIGIWTWAGGPSLVSDRTLANVIGKIEIKLSDMKISLLDNQQRTLFLQKTQLQANLAGIKAQLDQHPNDPLLIQRQTEVGNILEFVNREAANVQEKLNRARYHDDR